MTRTHRSTDHNWSPWAISRGLPVDGFLRSSAGISPPEARGSLSQNLRTIHNQEISSQTESNRLQWNSHELRQFPCGPNELCGGTRRLSSRPEPVLKLKTNEQLLWRRTVQVTMLLPLKGNSESFGLSPL